MTVSSKVKGTLATIKGAQSTLRIYSIHERDEKAKQIFKEAVEITDEVIRDLEKRVKAIEIEEPQYEKN